MYILIIKFINSEMNICVALKIQIFGTWYPFRRGTLDEGVTSERGQLQPCGSPL